ncbi:hypothetical protein pdam_00006366 [Pocillopora damicornis]|uniref:Uncharacterized protein n=1 Tax=Pocillopora damicornis TaxID=46731 RepID=A0A3M6TQP7_POCDA|nr:hypothetical protein pdam_00006366 [Pocillopora damicornis]
MVEHVCEKSLALSSKIEIANLVRRRGESERDLRGRFLYGKQIMLEDPQGSSDVIGQFCPLSRQTFKTLHESHIKLHPCDQKTINMCVTDLSRNLNPPPLLIPLPPPLPPPPPPPPPPPLLDVGRACSTIKVIAEAGTVENNLEFPRDYGLSESMVGC